MAYTLLMGGNSALVINPSLYDVLPFAPVKEFCTDLAGVSSQQNVARRSAPRCRSRTVAENWWRLRQGA